MTHPQKFSIFVSVIAAIGVSIMVSNISSAKNSSENDNSRMLAPTNTFSPYQDSSEHARTTFAPTNTLRLL